MVPCYPVHLEAIRHLSPRVTEWRSTASKDTQAHAYTCAQATKRAARGREPLQAQQENSNAGVAETPAVAPTRAGVRAGSSAPYTPAVPATAMRAPQLGEVFYSQKGERVPWC